MASHVTTIPDHRGPSERSPEELHAMAAELGIRVWTPDEAAPSRARRIVRAAVESPRGLLPARYATDTWQVPFAPRLADALADGVRVLDVGAGARPMVPPEERPPGCSYVGFDVDAEELEKAPAGSYDDIVVGDVCTLEESLVGEFDLVLSWLTMEHVKPVPQALYNLSRYQRPGGRFLGYLAGSFSVHAVLNRMLPHGVSKRLMQRLLGREPDTVFPARYDQCWQTALERVAASAWSQSAVVPLFTGGWYFRFSPLLRAPFLAYEEWAETGGHANLAAYYLIDGVR